MFTDYYSILDISENATQEEIKTAFKKQALKWHPDRNPGQDTTVRMQQINEAYLILKDEEARNRYDIEYQNFKAYQRQQEQFRQQQRQRDYKHEKTENKTNTDNDYRVNDDVLNNWMNNAKKQSVGLAQQMIEELKGMVKEGAKAAGKEVMRGLGCLLIMVIIGVLIGLIGIISRSCNNTTHSYPREVTQSSVSTDHPSNASSSNDYQTDKKKKTAPLAIPVDTFENEKSYKSFMIENVGYIYIPSNMELQSGKYKEFAESGQKQMARKFHYFVADDRIVFQQEGLNNLSEKGFTLYARVIIETSFGTFDDYSKQTDDFSVTQEELSELSITFQKQVKENFQGTGLKLIKWEGASLVKVNNAMAIKLSYIRQLNDNPYVHVDMYYFQNNDRMHTLTFSYQQKDSTLWKPLFSKTINSFYLTNVR